VSLLDDIRAEKLIALAQERFAAVLPPAEAKVLRDSASSIAPAQPEASAPRPLVRPDFVRWLATDPNAAPLIDPKGLRVYDATLQGKLDLDGSRILVILDFCRCTVQGEIDLQQAETRDIFFWDSSLEPYPDSSQAGGGCLRADTINVHGSMILKGSRFSGVIRLLGARIDGPLELNGAKLLLDAKLQQPDEDFALCADCAEIRGNLFLSDLIRDDRPGVEGFESSGAVVMPRVQVKGYLVCDGATLKAKDGDALSANGAQIEGSIFVREKFSASGPIRLQGAEIGGDLTFFGPQVDLVDCTNVRLSGDMYWMGIRKTKETHLDLTGARVKNLRDDRDSLPAAGHLVLDGLVYEELTRHEPTSPEEVAQMTCGQELPLDARQRIEWLLLQPPERRIKPQPWMQLSKHLEGKGDHKGAKHVLYKLSCLQAEELTWRPWEGIRSVFSGLRRAMALFLPPWNANHPVWTFFRHPNRSWAIAFAWLEEAPLRILYPIAMTLLLGTLIFAGAGRSNAMMESFRDQSDAKALARSAHYPPFQPFVYTVDNAVPLVKLGMDEAWMPDRAHVPRPWFPGHPWLDWLRVFNSYWFLAISRWLIILLGWFQATVLAAALSGRFKQ
jgi:hypothetical protein